MNIVETYGSLVQRWCPSSPDRARWLLKTGWQAQNLKYHLLPEQRLSLPDQYLARMMMDMMLAPLRHPERSAIVSVFTPCELLQEVGLHPYNVESFSCYLTASKAERSFLQTAEDRGLSDTLCSYHRTFLGAAEGGLLPKPRCIVYTNVACDANLVTFQHLAGLFQVPAFAVDVPMQQNAASVQYVAGQLRALAAFLEEQTGKHVDEDALAERTARSRHTLEQYDRFMTARADRFIPADLVTPLYVGMTNNVLLGTEEEAAYVQMLLDYVPQAPLTHGKRIYWMHTIPFWSDAVKEVLELRDDAVLVGCELAVACDPAVLTGDPYEQMASRLVYHVLNGPVSRRIDSGIRTARQVKADGVVWFNHWGCKHTLGGSRLAKKRFEEQGIPMLLLDGDGCDRSHGGEGQTATRLGAFLEMLEGNQNV